MMWNRGVISKPKGPERNAVFAENQRQKTRKVSNLILNVLFLPFQTGTAMENLDVLIPDLTEEQQGEGGTQIRALAHAHCTAVFARAGDSEICFLWKHTHLLAWKRETSSQLPALPQALVRLCASGNLDTGRRLCCALNAWWAISVPWCAVLGVFVPVCKTAWSEC